MGAACKRERELRMIGAFLVDAQSAQTLVQAEMILKLVANNKIAVAANNTQAKAVAFTIESRGFQSSNIRTNTKCYKNLYRNTLDFVRCSNFTDRL